MVGLLGMWWHLCVHQYLDGYDGLLQYAHHWPRMQKSELAHVLAFEQCELGVPSMETGAPEVDEVALRCCQFSVIHITIDHHVFAGKLAFLLPITVVSVTLYPFHRAFPLFSGFDIARFLAI